MERFDGVGVAGVVLAALAEADEARAVELCTRRHRRPPRGGQRVLGQGGEAEAADDGGGTGQAGVDDLVGQAERLEDLGAAVAVDGGDAHLGGDLEDAVLQRRPQAVLGLGRVGLAELVGVGQQRHALQRQAGADGVGAVAEQAGHGRDVAGVAGVDHHRGVGPQPGGDQPVVHRAGGQQAGHRRPVGADAGVGHHDDGRAPSRTAASASSARRPIAAPRPAGPSATGKVASSRTAGNGARSGSRRWSTASG